MFDTYYRLLWSNKKQQARCTYLKKDRHKSSLEIKKYMRCLAKIALMEIENTLNSMYFMICLNY